MNKRFCKTVTGAQVLSLSLLLLLPGCDWFGDTSDQNAMTEDAVNQQELETAAIEVLTEGVSVIDKKDLTGNVLISMNGKPIVTTDSLASEKTKLFDANPQLKQMLPFMDASELDRNLAEGLMNQAMVDQYISEKGIDRQPAYEKEIKEGFKAVERMVNTKFFTQSFDIKVTDADARKFYDENKDLMRELVITDGGIKAVGIEFDNEEDARSFASQVMGQGGDLKKAAEAQNLNDRIRDFTTVNEESIGLDADVKTKVLGMTKFPTIEVVVTNDKKVWVVSGSGKEERQYRPFEQVKAGIKDYLEKEARSKVFDEQMAALRTQYNIHMNPEFFKKIESDEDEEREMPEGWGLVPLESAQADFDDAAETVAMYEQQMSDTI